MLKQASELPQWQQLKYIAEKEESISHKLAPQSVISQCQLEYDFSLQRMSQQSLNGLVELAKSSGLVEQIQDVFYGKKVNVSENRQVLHTALRSSLLLNAQRLNSGIAQAIDETLIRMTEIAIELRQKNWLHSSSKQITDIVNIGIGGSDLGPKMSVSALKQFRDTSLRFHFISDASPESFDDTVESLDPETTLFIVSSKSFTTRETLQNAKKARLWLGEQATNKHMIAITANIQLAQEFGINTILPIWDWVGGRFSLCSAINLILMIAIGPDAFMLLLDGAHSMDEHFLNSDFENNMPVMMALIGIWNVNFRHINNHCVLVYHSRLKHLVAYLQQLEMESNGKSIDLQGNAIDYATCPIIWGGLGNRAQHAYYQLLSQGTHHYSADFIIDASHDHELVNQFAHNKMKILFHGEHSHDQFHIKGGNPINQVTMKRLTPYTLGALIALYEHKVFVQGNIWHINSFDQFGVESSKVIVPRETSIASVLSN